MNVRLILRSAARTMLRGPAIQLVAISTVAVAVGVLFMLLTLIHTTDQMTERWAAHARIVAFFSPDTPANELEVARLTVATWDEVRAVRLIDQAAALAELRATISDGGETDDALLQVGLVPPSLELALHDTHQSVDAVQAIATRLRSLKAGTVEAVDYGRDLIERIGAIAHALHVAGLLIGTVVAFAMIFIISNTVRMTLYARRDELEIMQLVGATPGFIRAPCYIEGGLQGLLGAGLAIGVLWSTHRWIFGGISEVRLGGLHLTLSHPPLPSVFIVIGCAGLVGVAASHLATTRYLRGRA